MTMTDLAHNTFLTLELNNLQVREQGRALNCEKEGREVETHISRQAWQGWMYDCTFTISALIKLIRKNGNFKYSKIKFGFLKFSL